MSSEQKIIVEVNGELIATDVTLEALMERIDALEFANKQLRAMALASEAQLQHLIPRVNDIEDKIDWRK